MKSALSIPSFGMESLSWMIWNFHGVSKFYSKFNFATVVPTVVSFSLNAPPNITFSFVFIMVLPPTFWFPVRGFLEPDFVSLLLDNFKRCGPPAHTCSRIYSVLLCCSACYRSPCTLLASFHFFHNVCSNLDLVVFCIFAKNVPASRNVCI